jgi:hypothetical protein
MRISSSIVAFLFSALSAAGQVTINEFSASNLSDFPDNYGKHEDWIELYNNSATTANVSGWYLSDNQANPTKWMLPVNATIGAHGYLLVWCDGRDEVSDGEFHSNFKLNQTKGLEEVVLSDALGNVLQNVPLGLTQEGHAMCRETNGSATWMVTTAPTPGNSNNLAPKFTGYVEQPTVSQSGGFYSGSVQVDQTNTPANGLVRYTTDGTLPTAVSPVFSGLNITSTTVLKLRTFGTTATLLPSLVTFNTYFINANYSLPVFSVAANELTDLANGIGEIIPKGSIEYFNALGNRTAISYGELNRHGQDSWVNFQRSLDWISRDEMGYTESIRDTLFHYSERDEYQRFIFRASGDDNYPADNVPADPNNVHDGGCHIRDEYVQTLSKNGGLKLDVRAAERVILYLNGQYWGVYAIREKPDDHDYTDYTYDQGKYDLQYLMTWGGTWAEYGGDQAFTDWATTRDFIMNNSMADPTNYAQMLETYNPTSLIDYLTVNLMVVASDWLNYNTGWWRGTNLAGDHKKWGYTLWDLDATFDYYINYSGVPNTQPDAVPCDIEGIADFMSTWFNGGDVGQHEQIFLKLLDESPEFQQLYYSRYADHMNTVFSCENMLATFDSMVGIIAPEMPRHITRWGGSQDEWNGNIAEMRDFIEARCANVAQALVECYPVTGPYNLTLQVQTPGLGKIKLNTLTHQSFPWTGQYYGAMENTIEAIANDSMYHFLYWERSSGAPVLPNSTSAIASLELTEDDTLTAVFVNTTDVAALSTDDVLFGAYPNPASNELMVDIALPTREPYTIALYSMQGSLLYTHEGNQQQARTAISTSTLANGVYVLMLHTAQGNLQKKVAVSR